ncbi:LysR family transcriptional regulator [Sphingobium lactosutens]|uniref:LysR family transcriptional regulator n=1 Tax=Sphingobium lactosutens TaxID=522773 RepID=UPI001C4C9327
MLDKLDLGTLRTLAAIHDAASFTGAAERLGVEQSTVSYRIKALRRVFGDPLFVRAGNSIVATPRCVDLVATLRPMLIAMEQALTPGDFCPGNAQGQVVISCNFHERRALIPDALRRIRENAPGLRIELHEAAVEGRRQLSEGLADIVLGPMNMDGESFYRRRLFTDRYVCVMDPANPLATAAFTVQDYRDAQHLVVTHNGRWEALFVPLLRAQGVSLMPTVSVPSHDSIERLLVGSRLVASIPERLARQLEGGLIIRPFPIDVPIEINMSWTDRTHHSGVHVWVRQLLWETARQLRVSIQDQEAVRDA